MFTGLVETTGEILEAKETAGDVTLRVRVPEGFLEHAELGESISVNGVCLTAINFTELAFSCDVSNETLRCTTLGDVKAGSRVNLERALLPTSRLGGHIVSGHVDGMGSVVSRSTDARSTCFSIKAPSDLAKYIAAKGSITLNGVSLTVNSVDGDDFSVNIIPHTMEITNLNELETGATVNLEVDIIARHVERMLSRED